MVKNGQARIAGSSKQKLWLNISCERDFSDQSSPFLEVSYNIIELTGTAIWKFPGLCILESMGGNKS
jgi:hypothetical protein